MGSHVMGMGFHIEPVSYTHLENMTARGTLESQLAQAQQEAHQAQQEKTELELKLEDANDEWQDKLSQQKENPLAAAMTAYLQEDYAACGKVLSEAVSYTHLDVYKRQGH